MSQKPTTKLFATAFFLLLFVCGIFILSSSQKKEAPAPSLSAVGGVGATDPNWQNTLETIVSLDAPVSQASAAPVEILSNSQEPLTNAETLGRELFSAYAELEKKDALTPENQQKVVKELLAKAVSSETIKTERYALSDIRTFQSTHAKELGAYRTELAAIINKHGYSGMGTELEKLESQMKNGSDETVALAKASSAYKKIAQELLALSAPQSIASVHLSLVNSFFTLSATTEAMTHLSKDPLAALSAVPQYQAAARTISASFKVQL